MFNREIARSTKARLHGGLLLVKRHSEKQIVKLACSVTKGPT
jgi:hypothetical protein